MEQNPLLLQIDAVLIANNATPEFRQTVRHAVSHPRTHKRRRVGTVKQAAQLFSPPVNPRTVQRLAKAGLLDTIRISPRQVRYDLEQVERLATYGADSVAEGWAQP